MPNYDNGPSLGEILHSAVQAEEAKMPTLEAYKKAIPILARGEYNATGVVVSLAALYPDIFLKLVALEQPEPVWKIVDDHIRSGRKIDAIKAYRTCTGSSLIEAKNAVEARQDFMPKVQPAY